PYSNNFDLYENGRGEIWVLSSSGIYVLTTESLLADENLFPMHFSLSNGLPHITTANSYSALDSDGTLYISGTSGVARVNIEKPFDDVSELKASVPYIEADNVRIYPDADGKFSIPSTVRRLTIYAYVYNYSLIDPIVTYRLDGFDEEDTSVIRSELDPVYYTNLRGGDYRFVMSLKDPMGRESNTITVPITKQKAVYEHLWFILLMCLATIAWITIAVKAYINKRISDLEKQHKEEAEKERIGNELRMASDIQNDMLPHEFPPFPDIKEFNIYASMDPARDVGGDFYDFFMTDEDHLCIVIADVSGKGIPAALFMMISKVILQSNATMGVSAAEILERTNNALCSDNRSDMFVTIWIGILNIRTGVITAANAGHEYPALMQDGRFSLLKDKHGLVIGGYEGMKYTEYEIHLNPGDKLFLYTDGVPEATSSNDDMFGTDRMIDALNMDPGADCEQILKNVRQSVDTFVQDAEQFDDLTMLCLEYHGAQTEH
ncbi:MAG: SpoIIE family protein phosphatase, partial [Lachnospiraceae bacterium]|nr:SpoIIE family protein phosphatase [Lachnospiraceae bacterium]